MAEIPLQQKEKRNLLPLILGIVALLALLGWWFTRDTGAIEGTAPDTTGTTTGAITDEQENAPTAFMLATGTLTLVEVHA